METKKINSSDMEKDMYAKFSLIRSMYDPVRCNVSGESFYQRFIPTGFLDFHDYGAGCLCVRVYTYDHDSIEGETQIRIIFRTPDDGDFGGWSGHISKEEANVLFEKITQVFDGYGRLPSELGINEDLLKLGISVGYE